MIKSRTSGNISQEKQNCHPIRPTFFAFDITVMYEDMPLAVPEALSNAYT